MAGANSLGSGGSARPLLARCDTCVGRSVCARSGGRRSEYPACHRAVQRTALGRLAALIARCGEQHGIERARRDGLIELVSAQHRADRERWSEILEFSVARAGSAERMLRFSYAFPGFRSEPSAAARFVAGLSALYCVEERTVLERGLELSAHSSVELVLVGLEDAGSAGFRLKLYLQFRDDAGVETHSLASEWLGWPVLAARFAGRRLHMVGIDAGARGVSGAKLYFAVEGAEIPTLGGPCHALLAELGRLRIESLRDALVVHRMRSRDDDLVETPAQLDFGLAANEAPWRLLERLPSLAPLRPHFLEQLARDFRLAVRRLSLSLASEPGMTAYYVLAEEE